MSDDNLFNKLGAAMYGPQWQSPLARALDINLRSIQRWAAGEYPPPYHVLKNMIVMFLEHAAKIEELATQLKRDFHRNLPTEPPR